MSRLKKLEDQIKLAREAAGKGLERWTFHWGTNSFSIIVRLPANEQDLRARAAKFFRHLSKNPKAKYVPLAAVLAKG